MLHEATGMFMMADRVRELTVKKSSSMTNMDRVSICSSCYSQKVLLSFYPEINKTRCSIGNKEQKNVKTLY